MPSIHTTRNSSVVSDTGNYSLLFLRFATWGATSKNVVQEASIAGWSTITIVKIWLTVTTSPRPIRSKRCSAVLLHVLDVRALRHEGSVAEIADIRLVTRVATHVGSEDVLLEEGPGTVGTLEGPLIVVGTHVPPQAPRLRKAPATQWALVRPRVNVDTALSWDRKLSPVHDPRRLSVWSQWHARSRWGRWLLCPYVTRLNLHSYGTWIQSCCCMCLVKVLSQVKPMQQSWQV